MKIQLFQCLIAGLFCLWITPSQAQDIDFTGCPSGDERVESSNHSFETEVLELVNKERKRRRMKPLKWNDELAYAARYHAKDMIVDDYFEHESKDRKRRSLKKACGIFERIGLFMKKGDVYPKSENLAVGARSPKEVVKDWMTSKGHRQNILDKSAEYLGIAYVQDDDSEWGTYWVQCFGASR